MSNKETIRTIEQKRAEFAFKKVKEAKDNNIAGDYKSHVKKLPMLVKTNGLGQSLAFIKSKQGSNKAYEKLYKDISDWVSKEDPKKTIILNNGEDLLEKLISNQTDTYTYKAVTVEVLAFLNWLRRFVDGEIKDDRAKDDGLDD